MSENKHYEIKSTTSIAKQIDWQDRQTVWKSVGEGWAVLWQYHQVFTGKIEGGKINWLNENKPEPEDIHLFRLRAFNEIEEYHFWRSGQIIKGRSRRDDTDGEIAEFIDTQMILRSIVALPLTEKKALKTQKDKKEIRLLSRNYIAYHPQTFQAGYVDSRFLGFVPQP